MFALRLYVRVKTLCSWHSMFVTLYVRDTLCSWHSMFALTLYVRLSLRLYVRLSLRLYVRLFRRHLVLQIIFSRRNSKSFLVDVTVVVRGQVGTGVEKNRHKYGHISFRLFWTPFPTSVPTSGFCFLSHSNSWGKCVQPTATTSGLFISRLNKENFEIKQTKLQISKKLCWCSALCNLGCSKQSMKNELVDRSWYKRT